MGLQGGSVASLCNYDSKVCGFDSQPAPLACLFVKKLQILKPHNVYVETVCDLHEFVGPWWSSLKLKGSHVK